MWTFVHSLYELLRYVSSMWHFSKCYSHMCGTACKVPRPTSKKECFLSNHKRTKVFQKSHLHSHSFVCRHLVSQCTQYYKSCENIGKKTLCKDFNLIVTQLSQMVGQQSLMYQKLDRIACTATQLACLKHKIGLFSDVVFQGQGLILLADRPTQWKFKVSTTVYCSWAFNDH